MENDNIRIKKIRIIFQQCYRFFTSIEQQHVMSLTLQFGLKNSQFFLVFAESLTNLIFLKISE